MQEPRIAGSRKTAPTDVRIDARISSTVDRRLRMLAIVEKQPLNRLLSNLLDERLPSADELAARLAADIASEPVA